MALQPDQFETFIRLVNAAGQHGMPMPRMVPGAALNHDQLHRANTTYDEARRAHYARTMKGRTK